jgi:hypothetical protein
MQNIKLIKKLLTLSLLLMLFGFLVITDRTTANALPCCRDCIAEEEACGADCIAQFEANPNLDEEAEARRDACLSRCTQMRIACSYTPCTTTCSGGCVSSDECGVYGCVCTGTRCVCL